MSATDPALALPRSRAAVLTFEALRILGEYPEGAPDYDRAARDLLMEALERLAPGLGNPEILGLPCPAPRAAEGAAPPAAPAWVAEVVGGRGPGGTDGR